MSRFTSWFRPGPDRGGSQAEAVAAVRAKQRADLQDAMTWTALIMNDDIDAACAGLQGGRSSFHALGVAMTSFMRCMLGSERQVMADTAARLAECEAVAAADHKTAQRLAHGLARGRIYAPGTEYDLVRAQAHLMGAVVGVVSESIVEAMRGFYRLRKAFFILESIVAVDVEAAGRPTEPLGADDDSDSSGESDAFVDAQEAPSAATTPELGGGGDDDDDDPCAATALPPTARDGPVALDDPVDDFVLSGATMCFGLMLVVLSLVPPSFSRALSVVGFRGDRGHGIRMLWRSAAHRNPHGALSGMVLLGYYNGLLASRQRLGEAIDVLRRGAKSRTKQPAALQDFDLGIYAMAAQDWRLMRDSFLRCRESSDWSPATYYYAAGCAVLELYRDAVQRHAGDDAAAALKAEAEGYLRRAPRLTGRKRVMARPLPVETFLQRKVAKWEARASSSGPSRTWAGSGARRARRRRRGCGPRPTRAPRGP